MVVYSRYSIDNLDGLSWMEVDDWPASWELGRLRYLTVHPLAALNQAKVPSVNPLFYSLAMVLSGPKGLQYQHTKTKQSPVSSGTRHCD